MGMRIPESVGLEILSRLPVKSLTRFKCVCKSWSSSFQTSHFITKHRRNNTNLQLLLNLDLGWTPHKPPYIFSALSTQEQQEQQQGQTNNFVVTTTVEENILLPFFQNCGGSSLVFGPCNGLICLGYDNRVALWNPSTREFKSIPESTVPRPPSTAKTSFQGLGFGFDSTADDYKVVRFVANECVDDQWISQVELYSLKTDSWKEIPLPEVDPDPCPSFNNYVNGFYYWVTCDYQQFLSFDMANEKFSTLPFPCYDLEQCYWEFLDFNGLLGALAYPMEDFESLQSLDLWVMKKDGSWTRHFSIDSIPAVEKPLGIWKDGQIFFESSCGELVLFDPATRGIKKLGIQEPPDTIRLIAYVDSLVPINGRSEYEEHIIRQPVGEVLNGQYGLLLRLAS